MELDNDPNSVVINDPDPEILAIIREDSMYQDLQRQVVIRFASHQGIFFSRIFNFNRN